MGLVSSLYTTECIDTVPVRYGIVEAIALRALSSGSTHTCCFELPEQNERVFV